MKTTPRVILSLCLLCLFSNVSFTQPFNPQVKKIASQLAEKCKKTSYGLPAHIEKRKQIIDALIIIHKTAKKTEGPENPLEMDSILYTNGTGFVINFEGQRAVLTNSHIIKNAKYLYMTMRNGEKIAMEKIFIGEDSDLALIIPDAKARKALKDITPLEFTTQPVFPRDEVYAVGFPKTTRSSTSALTLALTETSGIISKIAVSSYKQSERICPIFEITAAINDGNSGGPVLSKKTGKVVGVSLQKISIFRAQGVFQSVPYFMVNQFLRDISDGKYDGVPSLNMVVNKAYRNMRDLYPPKLSPIEGMVVTGLETPIHENIISLFKSVITPLDENSIYPNDIITKIGEDKNGKYKYRVNYEGNIQLNTGDFVDYRFVIAQHQVGDTIPIELWRKSTDNQWYKIKAEIKLKPKYKYNQTHQSPVYLPSSDKLLKARYVILCGLSFIELKGSVGTKIIMSKVYTHKEIETFEKYLSNQVVSINDILVNSIEDILKAFEIKEPNALFLDAELSKDTHKPAKIHKITLAGNIDLYFNGLVLDPSVISCYKIESISNIPSRNGERQGIIEKSSVFFNHKSKYVNNNCNHK